MAARVIGSLALVALVALASASVSATEVPAVASCELLVQAQSFAARLLDTPFHRKRRALASVSAALELRQLCNHTAAAPQLEQAAAAEPQLGEAAAAASEQLAAAGACEFFVAVNGSDSASGTTIAAPFGTLGRARLAVLLSDSRPCTVWLRGGRHQLSAPLRLGAEDSNTTYAAWQAEPVVISGGQLLAPTAEWKPAAHHPTGVHVAQLPKATKSFTTLFHGGRRQIRARFPNIQSPEEDLFPSGYARCAAGKGIDPWGGTGWATTGGGKPGLTLHVDTPNRSGTHFTNWQQRVGGPAELWSPAKCYDDAGQDYSLKQHEGLYYNTTTLSPAKVTRWTDVEDTEVHSMHPEFWSNYGWRLKNATSESLHFGAGGFQDQAGPTLGRQNLCSFFVENQLAELDAPAEWFYRASDRTLFFFPNSSIPIASSSSSSSSSSSASSEEEEEQGEEEEQEEENELIGGTLDSLISVTGTKSQPVVGLTFRGLTFSHTGVTFLKPYFIPVSKHNA